MTKDGLTITIDAEALKGMLSNAAVQMPFVPTTCKGALQDLEPVDIKLRIVHFPGEGGNAYEDGESYVDCPRLRRFHDHKTILRCFEEPLGTKMTDEFHYKPETCSKECPHYKPKKG